MKITLDKIQRVKLVLPEEDREQIDKELKEGNLSPETMSKVAKFYNNFIAPKRLRKTKGAFGKKGANRKAQVIQRQREMLKKFREQAEKEDEEVS